MDLQKWIYTHEWVCMVLQTFLNRFTHMIGFVQVYNIEKCNRSFTLIPTNLYSKLYVVC